MQDIADKLNTLRYNVKAEAVIGNLLLNGYSLDDIIIQFKSSHRRNWDGDILNCESKGGKIYIELSRDGLFDALPEYLFLKSSDNHSLYDREKQKVNKLNAQQRIHANIIFNPIENAIFEKRIDIERFEYQIIFLLNGYCLDSLSDFFKIENSLDPNSRAKLVKLIPLLYTIAGDFPMTAKCLEYFLEQPVSYEIIDVPKAVSPIGINSETGLGSGTCGDDFIVNGEYIEPVPTIQFYIGPIESYEVQKYLEGGEKRTLINYFSNYFIPLEYDIELVIDVVNVDAIFALNNSFLGYNSSTN